MNTLRSIPRLTAHRALLAVTLASTVACMTIDDLPNAELDGGHRTTMGPVDHTQPDAQVDPTPPTPPTPDGGMEPGDMGDDDPMRDAATPTPGPVPPPDAAADTSTPTEARDAQVPDAQADGGEHVVPPPPNYSSFVTTFLADDQSAIFGVGPGRHGRAEGELSALDSKAPSAVRVPAATLVRLCSDDAGTDCQELKNELREPLVFEDLPAFSGVAYVEVVPFAILYRSQSYRGLRKAFMFGEYLASSTDDATWLGTFTPNDPSTTINDAAWSVFVPPGVRVRVCSDEGASKHGVNRCKTYSESNPDLFEIVGVSYLQVEPVLTAFSEPFAQGSYRSFGKGAYLDSEKAFAPLLKGGIGSLFVPAPLEVHACTREAAADSCVAHVRSSLELASDLRSELSELKVSPNDDTQIVTVTMLPSTATGVVTSFPHGFVCDSGTRSANFQTRSLVELRAALGPNASVYWEGCHRQSATLCEVYAENAASVKVRFDRAADPCVTACEAECPKARKPAYEACALDCKQCLDF